jgi:hypothetical protein
MRDARLRAYSVSGTVRFIRIALCLFALVACGDNAGPCDYVETDDVGNAATSEDTGLTIGDLGVHVCGAVDSSHYDPQLHVVDDDSYRVTLATDHQLLIQMYGDPGVELLQDIIVRFFDTATNPRLIGEGHYDPSLAAHGAFVVALPAGTYDMVVSARAPGDLSGALPYRIRLSPMPACDALTSPVDYKEAKDGGSDTGNDAVDVDFTHDPAFTAATSQPEATGLELAEGEKYLITGNASTASHADEYLDRDTFAITTGDGANELAIRLDWQGATSDLDYIVFEGSSMKPVVTSNITSTSQHELAMFAVKPRTAYWLWIGGYRGSTATDYGATVCANHFYY